MRIDQTRNKKLSISRNYRSASGPLRRFSSLDGNDAAVFDQNAALIDVIETPGRDNGDVGDPGSIRSWVRRGCTDSSHRAKQRGHHREYRKRSHRISPQKQSDKLLTIGSEHADEKEIKNLAAIEARVLAKLIVSNARMQSNIT
jgi:hypothetical protein